MRIVNDEQPRKYINTIAARNIYIGLVFIAVGIIWMCNNLDIVGARLFDAVFSWQILLMTIGGYFLTLRKWALGIVTFLIGATFALSDWFELHLPVSDVLLPMIVIAVGVVFLLQWRK